MNKKIMSVVIYLFLITIAISQTKFDSEQENYYRYKNSPCAETLGFIAGRDNETLYRICEEELQMQQLKKYGSITIVLLLIGGLIYYQRMSVKKV